MRLIEQHEASPPHLINIADIAGDYARAGLPVFPCGQNKAPLIARGVHASSNDPDTVNAMFHGRRNALVGVDCGRSGLVVLDLDRPGPSHPTSPDGAAHFAAFIKQHGVDISACPVTITPSGGRHVYFRTPPGEYFNNAAGAFAPHGVQVRASGGYVVGAGSRLLDGRAYRSNPRFPDLVETFAAGAMPILPPAIASAIRNGRSPARERDSRPIDKPHIVTEATASNRLRSYALSTLDRIAGDLAATPSNRSHALFAAAARAGNFVARAWLTTAEAQDALMDAAAQNGMVAQYGQRDCLATFWSALAVGMLTPAADPADRPRTMGGR